MNNTIEKLLHLPSHRRVQQARRRILRRREREARNPAPTAVKAGNAHDITAYQRAQARVRFATLGDVFPA